MLEVGSIRRSQGGGGSREVGGVGSQGARVQSGDRGKGRSAGIQCPGRVFFYSSSEQRQFSTVRFGGLGFWVGLGFLGDV